MKLSKLANIALFLSLIGCAHYKVEFAKPQNVSSANYIASLNFFSIEGRAKIKKVRLSKDDSWVTSVLEEIEKSRVFSHIETSFDDFTANNSVNIEITKEHSSTSEEFSIVKPFYAILPIPFSSSMSMRWRVFDQSGLVKEYNAIYDYEKYYFIPFIPYGIYQSRKYQEDIIERHLAREIIMQISKDRLVLKDNEELLPGTKSRPSL